MEKLNQFSSETLKAPFFLRCAALFIDYMVLIAVPLVWLIFSTFFPDGRSTSPISPTVWLVVLIFWLINFLLLPLLRGQSLGKMLAGITILNTDGTPIRLVGILRRNVLGYLITAITLGIGFLIAAINKSGRALHDYIGGTVVVYGRKKQI